NGANADYQIATIDATHGQSLTVTRGNGYIASQATNTNSRTAARLTTVTATASNNIVKAQVEIYTGAPTAGTGEYRFSIVGTAGAANVTLGGITYNVATGKLNGLG